MQLLKILDQWTECLEQGGQIDVLYTDLEKAFDKVPHNLLIKKLSSYNIHPVIIAWIKAFLSNRRQRVRVNDLFSEWVKVLSGIPQGSILGPLLFIIYVNDLVDACDSSSELYLYADDAKLYRCISHQSDQYLLQQDINKLNDWIKRWLLKLNIDKCKIASYGRHISLDTNYNIDNVKIEKVNTIKDLGVVFDTRLKFDIHINEKINKAYSILGLIKRNFQFITEDAFVILYKSMVRSHLEYANSVWCPHNKEDIRNLEKVQMRASKLVRRIRHLSYPERLRKLGLPTLKYRRIRGDMIEIYKLVSGKYDKESSIDLNFRQNSVTRGNSLKLYKEHVKYDLRKYFFKDRVVDIWNSLPESVVSANSINAFKNRLDKCWCNQDVYFDYEAEIQCRNRRP
jgi:hypothetical protein